MKGLATMAALLAGGLVVTLLLGNLLQQQAVEPIDTLRPSGCCPCWR
jgi:hypothetical protein